MRKSCTVQALAFVAALAPLILTLPAVGQTATQETPPKDTGKTVSWYADHQQERAQMQLRCLDDPGHLRNTPDCINAERGAIEAASRNFKHRFPEMDPRKVEFWSQDPQGRANKLLLCRTNPQLEYCDVAKRSLLVEAGKAKR